MAVGRSLIDPSGKGLLPPNAKTTTHFEQVTNGRGEVGNQHRGVMFHTTVKQRRCGIKQSNADGLRTNEPLTPACRRTGRCVQQRMLHVRKARLTRPAGRTFMCLSMPCTMPQLMRSAATSNILVFNAGTAEAKLHARKRCQSPWKVARPFNL